MKPPESAALHEALALLRAPRGPRPGPGQRLPEGMPLLMRLVAGEEGALQSAQAATGEAAQTLREAAIFYIQQVCFAPGGNSYRVLGVDASASDERIREHYRWLARWLHPDRNPDQWEIVFAERVGQAWQDLRTAERRQRYDSSLHTTEDWSSVVAAQPIRRSPAAESRPARGLPASPPKPHALATTSAARNLRWVPSAVLAGLAGSALVLVVLLYAFRPRASLPTVAAEISPDVSLATTSTREPLAIAAQEVPPDVVELPPPVVPDAPMTAESPAMVAAEVADPVILPPAIPTPRRSAPDTPISPPPPPEAVAASVRIPPPKPPKSRQRDPAPQIQAPSPAAKQSPTLALVPASVPVDVGARDANRLLGHLSQAYEDGDLQGMRSLFAADAQGPRGGLDSILADYHRVFADSRQRSLAVRDVNWFLSGDTFTIIASFEATITKGRSGRPRRSHGDLRLDLRRAGEKWQIYRMQHDEKPG